MKYKRVIACLVIMCLVFLCNITAYPLAAERELSLINDCETVNVSTNIEMRSIQMSIPHYYYRICREKGVYTYSPTVYRTITVPTGKKVVVGDAKIVSITDTYNGEKVISAERYEYSYRFE